MRKKSLERSTIRKGAVCRQDSSASGIFYGSGKMGTRVLASRLFDLVCPGYCLICGESEGGSTICHDCVGRFRALLYQACPRCAAPAAPGGLPCSFCHQGRYPFEHAHALGVYRGFLRDAILFAKRPGGGPLAYKIGQILGDAFAAQLAEHGYSLLTAAPVHWRRRLRRGFNGAELIIRGLQTRLRVPASGGLLVHRRPTRKQSMLSSSQRGRNVKRAFRLGPGHDLAGQQILLVDDVMTTGKTAGELSRVLRRAGAERVDLLVVARGLPPADRKDVGT